MLPCKCIALNFCTMFSIKTLQNCRKPKCTFFIWPKSCFLTQKLPSCWPKDKTLGTKLQFSKGNIQKCKKSAIFSKTAKKCKKSKNSKIVQKGKKSKRQKWILRERHESSWERYRGRRRDSERALGSSYQILSINARCCRSSWRPHSR